MTAPATADEPERPAEPSVPEITAHRFTARQLVHLIDCDGCGKPAWSVNGVDTVGHQDDADNETCPLVQVAAERRAAWLMDYESIHAKLAATHEPPPDITITTAAAAATWNAAPPVTYEQIAAMFQAVEDRNRAAHERWAAHWRGRLDGATLNQVMRLRHRGELPHACHLVAGPDALDAIRRRFAIQDRLPDFAIPTGAGLRHLDSVDIITDPALGDSWELRTGGPRPLDADDRGEVIARGTRLA